MPYEDAADYRFNPFDLTKVWPHGDYPLIKVGRYVLDRNPSNYFAEIEQAAFEPANLVPGIGPSPDKMLQGRLFAYPDAHRYRIGPNYTQLPVNAPNSFGGPHADAAYAGETSSAYGVEDEVIRSAYKLHAEDDDFGQAGTLVREVLSDEQREWLAQNIIGHVGNNVSQPVLERVFEYWRNVDKNLGDKVAGAFEK